MSIISRHQIWCDRPWVRSDCCCPCYRTFQEKRSYAKGAKIIIQGQKIVQRGQKPIKGQTVPAELYIVLSSLGKSWGGRSIQWIVRHPPLQNLPTDNLKFACSEFYRNYSVHSKLMPRWNAIWSVGQRCFRNLSTFKALFEGGLLQ